MSMHSVTVREFNRRVFVESYPRIFKYLSLLGENEVWKSPNPQVASVGNQILHLCGHARQWILSGLGDRPDNRNRDQEFVPQQNIRKADLIFLLENLKVNVQQVLKEMDDRKLVEELHVDGTSETGFSVLIHVIEHFSYHAVQIKALTKLMTHKDKGYFRHFDLNQLN